MKVSVLGIDLGKNVFHVYGIDERGQPIVRKKLTRHKLQAFMANLEPCLVGLEACRGAHHWARTFQQSGHEVRLMSPQFVKP
jgi:transposase